MTNTKTVQIYDATGLDADTLAMIESKYSISKYAAGENIVEMVRGIFEPSGHFVTSMVYDLSNHPWRINHDLISDRLDPNHFILVVYMRGDVNVAPQKTIIGFDATDLTRIDQQQLAARYISVNGKSGESVKEMLYSYAGKLGNDIKVGETIVDLSVCPITLNDLKQDMYDTSKYVPIILIGDPYIHGIPVIYVKHRDDMTEAINNWCEVNGKDINSLLVADLISGISYNEMVKGMTEHGITKRFDLIIKLGEPVHVYSKQEAKDIETHGKELIKYARGLCEVPQEPAAALELPTPDGPFQNREESWLEFNKRVLHMAKDKANVPLLERLKFLAIANSNLDEFFQVRISSRINDDMIAKQNGGEDKSLKKLMNMCDEHLNDIAKLVNELGDELQDHNITLSSACMHETDRKLFEARTSEDCKIHFEETILPTLTPLVVDTTRPLQQLKSDVIYISLIVKDQDGIERVALVEVPEHLERLLYVKTKFDNDIITHDWIFIESIIIDNLAKLFPGMEFDDEDVASFRILRNGDVSMIEDDGEYRKGVSYVDSIMNYVRDRVLYNEPVRVDFWGNKPRKKIVNLLKSTLDISKKFMFASDMPLKQADLIRVYTETKHVKHLKYGKDPVLTPFVSFGDKVSVFDAISQRDRLVHHPYESFNDTVVRFVDEASTDPHVKSIKMTLYRPGKKSAILDSLIKASKSGKSVTAVVELKARFDEEPNLQWVEKLRDAGANVVYGLERYKVHAKLLHVSRYKNGISEQYVHIGTGNYSEKNAKIYTDYSLFTSEEDICSDVNKIFNLLTGGYVNHDIKLDKLVISPLGSREFIMSKIQQEIEKGKNGSILLKMNNISDKDIINKLYEASNAGVEINIICRAVCSLVPGKKEWSENIDVRSIVGKYLEHNRVMIFGDDVYITSADLLSRNMDRRIEVTCPIINEKLASRITTHMYEQANHDDVNSFQNNEGVYIKIPMCDEPFMNTQDVRDIFYKE